MTDIPGHGVLGKETAYRFDYDATLLFPIARQQGRAALGIAESLPFRGMDRWTAYELSWLNPAGLPQVMIAEFDFPCDSPCIIESKSFKLYLNSFNANRFPSPEAVRDTLAADLSRACGAAVVARLYALSDYRYEPLLGYDCLDALSVACDTYDTDASLLACGSSPGDYRVCSHLFRSLCPVTGQPDWASVFIDYAGQEILPESLLRYLVSFRNHQGFHEQCTEQIFMDLSNACQPSRLTVYARFTRRGGLDINPLRTTIDSVFLPSCRESRQ